MRGHIFKWNGQPLGFIRNGKLFASNSDYLGWVEDDGSVWAADGHYVGEVVEGEYILRRSLKIDPIPKIPKIPPISPIPPIPPLARIGKIPRVGWIDPFDK
jgi:hypothetical protein